MSSHEPTVKNDEIFNSYSECENVQIISKFDPANDTIKS